MLTEIKEKNENNEKKSTLTHRTEKKKNRTKKISRTPMSVQETSQNENSPNRESMEEFVSASINGNETIPQGVGRKYT